MKRAAAVLALLAASAPGRVDADGPPPSPATLPERGAQIVLEDKVVRVSVGYRDALDAPLTKKLENGLPTVITMRGYLFRDGADAPVALAARSCRIVYDLWDEVFRIQLVQQPGGASSVVAVNVEGVMRNCCEAKKLPLVDRALLAEGTRYFVAAIVEVNPVSQQMLDRIKRWVTRPNGQGPIGPGDSLFGSFVGLFVARIDSADKTIAFRTPSFLPPPDQPPPPP